MSASIACVAAQACTMDPECVDYHQCVEEQAREAALEAATRQAAVEQFRTALLTGLDGLQRYGQFQLVDPEDVGELVARVAQEVGR